jgi:hypothetical protein
MALISTPLLGAARVGAALVALTAIGCTASAPSAPTARPTPCPADVLTARVRVGNAGGGPVAFHRVPDLDPSSHELSYPEGTQLRVVEAPIVAEGVTFALVRAGDGVEGYLPVRYLVPEPDSGCFAQPASTPARFRGK